MSEEQVQPQRSTAAVKYRCRRNRLDGVEQEPVLPDDFLVCRARHDQYIGSGMIIASRQQTVLVCIRAEADDRQPATQRVIDFSGIGPSERRDGQIWPIEEPPLCKLISERSPVDNIEGRVLAEPKFSDSDRKSVV